MSHFSDESVITLNMFYINSSHHPNTLVIISIPVDTASPFLLSLQSSCATTSLTVCYSMMIYINVIQTGLYFVYFLFCYFACLYCMFILWLFHFAFDKVLLKNFTTTTTIYCGVPYLLMNFLHANYQLHACDDVHVFDSCTILHVNVFTFKEWTCIYSFIHIRLMSCDKTHSIQWVS